MFQWHREFERWRACAFRVFVGRGMVGMGEKPGEHTMNVKRISNRKACAAALILLIGLPSVILAAPSQAAPAVLRSCSATHDSWGFGGTYVSCPLTCDANALLANHVKAHDPDAGVSGDYTCGDQAAHCDGAIMECWGVSPGLTQFKQVNATCEGRSHENWNNAVSVQCFVIGGVKIPPNDDIKEWLCNLIPNFPECRLEGCVVVDPSQVSGASPPRVEACATRANVPAECDGFDHLALSSQELDDLFPDWLGDSNIVASTSILLRPDGTGVSVLRDAGGCDVTEF